MQLVIGDFETFYDKDYSLTSMSTSEYIRDRRFEAQLFSVKVGKQSRKIWVGPDIRKAINDIDWANSIFVAHHNNFDGFILSEHYGKVPARYACTLSMARVALPIPRHHLGAVAKYLNLKAKIEGVLIKMKGKHLKDLTPSELRDFKEYGGGDTDICNDAYHKMLKLVPDEELELIDSICACFCDPILEIDVPRVTAVWRREIREKAKKVKLSETTVETLMSNQRFAAYLKTLGVDPPRKISKTTGKNTFAFAKSDLDFQELAYHQDPRVQKAYAARLAVKSTIGETRAQRFITMGTTGSKKFAVYYNYGVVQTQRLSGGNKMNAQNLQSVEYDEKGKEIKHTGEIRRSIKAPHGHVVIVRDSSQVEARTNLWNAGQEDGLEDFRLGRDAYATLASKVYGFMVDKKKNPNERFVGKVGVLGLGFQMGGPKFQLTLAQGVMGPPIEISLELAYKTVETYRAENDKIVAFWDVCNDILWDMHAGNKGEWKAISWSKETIHLPGGLKLRYPGLETFWKGQYLEDAFYQSQGKIHIYGGKLTENIIQALARVAVMSQLMNIKRRLKTEVKLKRTERCRLVMTTHDEGVVVAPTRYAEVVQKIMAEEMGRSPSWAPDLPVTSEGGYAENYSK